MFVIPLFFGAIFQMTDRKTLGRMIRLAGIRKWERVVDLGSGDGKILMYVARMGARVWGYEINPFLVLWSRFFIWHQRLRAYVVWGDFWKKNLGSFDVVFVFQRQGIMGGLERKLIRDLKVGSRVVSHHWPFPNWKACAQDGDVYLYMKR